VLLSLEVGQNEAWATKIGRRELDGVKLKSAKEMRLKAIALT